MKNRLFTALCGMIGSLALAASMFCHAQEPTTAVAALQAESAPAMQQVRLGDLEPQSQHQGWGELQIDKGVAGAGLSIGGRTFAHGLGTHAVSEIVYDLEGKGETFSAWVGVDDYLKNHPDAGKASVVFKVIGDGKPLFDSGVMRMGNAAKRVEVSVKGVSELKLVVTDAVDGIACDHADWADPIITGMPVEDALPPSFSVQTSGLAISLDKNGHIVGSSVAALTGQTRLTGCKQVGDVSVKKIDGGGYAFTRQVADAQNHHATVIDQFTPTKDSIRWEVQIVSNDAPWSTSIDTWLHYPATPATRFWTGWADPMQNPNGWRDPLVLQPLSNTRWNFGGPLMGAGNFIVLPLATVAESTGDLGLSIVCSPEDTFLNVQLKTSSSGHISFTRGNYRIGGGKPLTFAMDLIRHEADWRGGLRWMVARYPQFFDPPNPHADQMAGCGAYSGDENPIDVAKFKKMAFRFNWKLSDDFPYMGMFIPPVKDADEHWERSCDEKAPANKPRWTSCRRLNDYAKYMKDNGFFVLDYFNVTEYGKNMGGTPARKPGDPELWKDPRAFLTTQLSSAIFRGGNATCYNASLVDPGDEAFQKFVLEQADRHIKLIPDSFGIDIDRMDWLAQYNRNADDGISWIDGKPARALSVSWNNLLSKLGPRMHQADKVIFGNPLYARLDLLRHLDGIYTEGRPGPALNAIALMGLRKPVTAWTDNDDLRQPDAFFQQHLLLGVYPTAPYPWNNHCVTPEPSIDAQYMDYGPLLDAMRGKKWVLEPHCIETTTPGVKVNMFQIPGGYVVPVTFGDKAETATVKIRNVTGLTSATCTALQPGVDAALLIPTSVKDGSLEFQVPLKRGCAMVIITTK